MKEDQNDFLCQSAAIEGFSAGFTFGNLIFRNNSYWSDERIDMFVSELKPKYPLDRYAYCKGFYYAFIKGRKQLSGNMLPRKGNH